MCEGCCQCPIIPSDVPRQCGDPTISRIYSSSTVMCPTIAKITRSNMHRPVVANASRRTADPGADESPGLDALNSLIPTSFVPTSAPAIDRGNISVHLPCPSSIHGTALFLFLLADFHMSFTISAETIFQVLVCKSKTLGMLFQAQAKSKPRCFSFSFGSRHFCNKKLVFTSCTKVIIWLKGIQ